MVVEELSVVKALLGHKGLELSIRALAGLIRKDYKNTYVAVKRLEKAGVLTVELFGNTSRVLLSTIASPILFTAEFERRAELIKKKDFAVMLDSFTQLRSRFYVLLLFGSYAKGTATKHSDIDLLFVVPKAFEVEFEKEINTLVKTLPLPFHIHVFSDNDFKAMNKSKEVTVGSQAIQHNVVLHGIETYYELLQ